MMNPYVMNMIAKQRQEELRRMAALYRRNQEQEESQRAYFREGAISALFSVALPVSLIVLFIGILAVS